MPKNKHLLVIIAVLALGNVFACIVLVLSEKSNGRRIEGLSGQLQATRQENERAQAELNAKFAKETAKLSDELQKGRARQDDLEKRLDKTHEQLATAKTHVAELRRKKWLMAEGDGSVPSWVGEVGKLRDGLKSVDETLRRLTAPKDGAASPKR